MCCGKNNVHIILTVVYACVFSRVIFFLCGRPKTLTNLQEIVDNWLGMQMQWMGLEPIFSSDDIKKQLPLESKRFVKVGVH